MAGGCFRTFNVIDEPNRGLGLPMSGSTNAIFDIRSHDAMGDCPQRNITRVFSQPKLQYRTVYRTG